MAKTGYESWSIDQVRHSLVLDFGMDVHEAKKIKGKTAVVAELLRRKDENLAGTTSIDTDFEEVPDATSVVCEITEKEEMEKETDPDRPQMTDPAWHDYVMGHFIDEELINGNPTVDGLRRVTQLLLGPIVKNVSHIVKAPSKEDMYRAATVTVMVTVTRLDLRSFEVTVSGSADVSRDNTDDPYHLHPTATAETKAEGRAYRKHLNLRKVLAAEEASDRMAEVAASEIWHPDAKITPELKEVFGLLAKNADVNLKAFINAGKMQYTNVDEIPFNTAKQMHKRLTEYANGSLEVPGAFKGYKADWDK